MTDGDLAMIACPMLEDEMVYSLSHDGELGEVLLMENDNSSGVASKLDGNGIRYRRCGEDDFLSGDARLPDGGYNVVIWMMDLGLHEEPGDLRGALEKAMLGIQDRVDAIVLYYGLCGNALKDIEEWASANLRVPVTLMKDGDGRVCDDCIAVAVGGTDKYLRLLRKYPGILYFTPAYATNWDEMKRRMELFRGVDVDDDSMMKMILDMADYHNVMEIPTGLGDEEASHEETKRFADKMGLNVMRLDDGWCTLEPAERTYENAKGMLHRKDRNTEGTDGSEYIRRTPLRTR